MARTKQQRRRLLDRTVKQVKARNASVPPEVIESEIAEAVAAVQKARFTKKKATKAARAPTR